MHFSVEMLSENIGLKTESKSNSKFVFLRLGVCIYNFYDVIIFWGILEKIY